MIPHRHSTGNLGNLGNSQLLVNSRMHSQWIKTAAISKARDGRGLRRAM